MPKDRYYLNQKLSKNSKIEITSKEAIHIRSIMRKNQNDIVEVVNGKGILAKAQITNIGKKSIKLRVQDAVFTKEKKQKIILIQSFIKPNKIDLVLEKCTELGCDEFWLYKSKNSEKFQISKNRLVRMQTILISALKQCSRLYLPKIRIFKNIEEINNLDGSVYFGDFDTKTKKYMDLYKKSQKNIYFCIGPEKGFLDEEILYLKKHLKAKGARLNNNVLRAETAAIAAICITSHLLQS